MLINTEVDGELLAIQSSVLYGIMAQFGSAEAMAVIENASQRLVQSSISSY